MQGWGGSPARFFPTVRELRITPVFLRTMTISPIENPGAVVIPHPDLKDKIAKLQAVAKRLGGIRSGLDDLKQNGRIEVHRRVLRRPFSEGYLATHGGYWFVPAPHGIKISFKTGLIFDLEDPGKMPMMEPETKRRLDIIDLWRLVKDVAFEHAVRDLQRWIDQRENGFASPDSAEVYRDDAYCPDLKECTFHAVFANEQPVQRGSARHFWKMLKESFGKNWKQVSQDTPDFSSAPRFLKLLQFWCGTQDSRFFTVKDHARSKNTTFTLSFNPESFDPVTFETLFDPAVFSLGVLNY
jgi:hypothetical protein